MSSSGNVDLQFTASDKAAIAAWQSQQKLADSLIRKLEKLEQVSEKTSKGLDFKNTGIGSVVTDLAKMATSIGSVYAVMRQIRVEYEAILQERGGAALEHVQYRIAAGNAFRNSGNLFKSPQAMDAYIAETARLTNQTRVKVAGLIDSGLSAQGAKSPEDLKSVQETMMEVLKTYPELSTEDTQAVLQAAQDVRSKNPNLTAAQAVGFNLKTGQVGRVVSPLANATNVSPPTLNMTSYGGTLQEAGALAATMTHGMKDWTGEITGTAMLTLGRELKERLPKLSTSVERLEAFQKNPKWVEAYFQGGMIDGKKFDKAETGRGKAEPTIRALMDANSQVWKNFKDNLAEFGGAENWAKATAHQQKFAPQITGGRAEEIQRAGKAIQQDIRLGNERGAVGAASEESLAGILTAAGFAQAEVNAEIVASRVFGGSPEEQAKRLSGQLKRKAADLRERAKGGFLERQGVDTPSEMAYALIRHPLKTIYDIGGGAMQAATGTLPMKSELSARASQMEAASAQVMKLFTDRMENLTEELKKNTAATKENTKSTSGEAVKPGKPAVKPGKPAFNPQFRTENYQPSPPQAFRPVTEGQQCGGGP